MTSVNATGVTVADGSEIVGSAVVVATEGPVASELLGIAPVGSKSAGCVYFAADEAPTDSKMVILDGTGVGPVLNVAVMSNVATTYAPPGKHLVVAALPGVCDGDIEGLARRQLRGWWGAQVDEWEPIATYRIPHGQPSQAPPFAPKLPGRPRRRSLRVRRSPRHRLDPGCAVLRSPMRRSGAPDPVMPLDPRL